MRILVCSPYAPYPPRGGGRADVWRRIEAFARLGHSVMLLHQHEPDGPRMPLPEHFAAMDEVLDARYSFAIERGRLRTIRQLLGMWRLPWHVAEAVPSGDDEKAVDSAVREFRPDVIWLEGPWLGEVGRRFMPSWASHSRIDHRTSSTSTCGARHELRTAGVTGSPGDSPPSASKKYERTLMRMSRRVLDISVDDLAFWREEGIDHIHWLPPLPELALTGPPVSTIAGDVVFAGGLRLPNNIHGVRWLIDDVLPILLTTRPDLTVIIVGAAPDAVLRAQLEANPAVRSFFDVPSVNPTCSERRFWSTPYPSAVACSSRCSTC